MSRNASMGVLGRGEGGRGEREEEENEESLLHVGEWVWDGCLTGSWMLLLYAKLICMIFLFAYPEWISRDTQVDERCTSHP